jgi:hypothetical protein
VRRALGVGRSVERDFWHPRATALVRNPASLSDEQRDFHSPSRELCTRCERPRRRAAEKRDELASFHSITPSARAKNVSGIVRPSALAVLRLTTRSNLVGCSTGISAGFTPRRILSTDPAVRRKRSGKFAA